MEPCKSFVNRSELCEKVDRTSMMKSREHDETKKKRLSIAENLKEYGGKVLLTPCKLSFANRMMKSREYDETKKAVVYSNS